MSLPEEPAARLEIPKAWICCEITGLPQEAKLAYWQAFRAIDLRANKNNPRSLIVRPNVLETHALQPAQFLALLSKIQTLYPDAEIIFY